MNRKQSIDYLCCKAYEGGLGGFNTATRSCQYITSDGRKCAVGALLSEEDLNTVSKRDDLKSADVNGLLKHLDLEYIPFEAHELAELQGLHDTIYYELHKYNVPIAVCDDILARALRVAHILME